MDHLDLTTAKESRRIKSALCVIPGKLIALPVGSINIDQRALGRNFISVRHNKDSSTYKINYYTISSKKFSSCEQVESNALSSMIDDTDKMSENSEASSREQRHLWFTIRKDV